MGPDFFTVLKLERRPWIDLDQLKQNYQQRTFATHPDRSETGEAAPEDFTIITEAYRVLSSPRLRLQHLLGLEGDAQSTSEPAPVPQALSDLFMKAAQLVNEIDSVLQKREHTTSGLGKSLLQRELTDIRIRTSALVNNLETHYADAVNGLRTVDAEWTRNRAQAVREIKPLVQRFAFLERWLNQLREKEFQLSS